MSAQEARATLTEAQQKEVTRLRLLAEAKSAEEERSMERWKTVDFKEVMQRLEERIRETSALRQNEIHNFHVGDDKRGEVLSGLVHTALTELGYTVRASNYFVQEDRGGWDAPSYPAHWSYSLHISW